MDAVSLIDKHIDVEKLLHHYNFNHIKESGNYLRAACKLHEGDNPSSFVISKDKGLYFCHTKCGGGNIYQLIQKLEKCSFPHAVQVAANLFGVSIKGLDIVNPNLQYLNEMRTFIKVIKGMRRKELVPFTLSDEIRQVVKFRDFSEDTLRHFNLGYASQVKLKKSNNKEYTLRKRLVFPFVQQGVQIAVLLRRTIKGDLPKWSNQPKDLLIGNFLYNYDAIGSSPIVVCEGITDVWAYHEIGVTAVATLGAHITNAQYRLLLKTGQDIMLSYDGDKAGVEATQRAITLFQNKANLFVIPMGATEDPASISRGELKRRYENICGRTRGERTNYTSF